MNKQQVSNFLHIGGTVETALSGRYQLNASEVVQEATQLTQRHFWQFLPAILILVGLNTSVFLLVLRLFLGDIHSFFVVFLSPDPLRPELLSAAKLAVFIATVISAPFYAGASLMGLSHAIGLKTKPRHIVKALGDTFAIIGVTACITLCQNIGNALLPMLGLGLSILFSLAVLLICEKRQRPLAAMALSCRAIIKKPVTFFAIYIVIGMLFVFSYVTAGVALAWALPFMFNTKGILYRDVFGVGIEVTVAQQDADNTHLFNA